MKITLSLTFFLISFSVSFSQNNLWTPLRSMPGGSVLDLDIDGKGNLYACVGSGSLYYSQSNGDSWQKVPGVIGTSLTVGQNDTLYVAGIGSGIYSGIDVFALHYIPSTISFQSLLELKDGSILGLMNDFSSKFYRSTDGGKNWTAKQVLDNINPHFMRGFIQNDEGSIFYATPNGFFRSDDNGETFVIKNNGITEESVGSVNEVVSLALGQDGTLYRTSALGAYKSTDNGDTWTSIKYNLPGDSNEWLYGAITIDENNTLYLISTYSGKSFSLAQDQLEWQHLSDFNLAHEYGYNLVYNKFTGTLFRPSMYTGLFRFKKDGLENWEYADEGIYEEYFTRITVLKNEDVLVIPQYGYRLYSNEEWSRNYFDTNFPKESQENVFGLTTQGDTLVLSGNSGIGYVSTDAKTWTQITRAYPDYISNIIVSNSKLYAFVFSEFTLNGDIWVSEDMGTSWNPLMIQGPSSNMGILYEMVPDPQHNLLYVVFYDFSTGTNLIQIDVALKQSTVILNDYISSIHVMSDHSLIGLKSLPGNQVVVKYDPQLQLWTEYMQFPYGVRLNVVDDLLLVSSGKDIYFSADKAESWKIFSVNEGYNGVATVDKNGFIYAAQSQSTVFKSKFSVFDTESPYIVDFAPADEATDVAMNTNLSLTFNEPIDSIAAQKIVLFKAGETDPLMEIPFSSGTIADKVFSVSLAEPLPPSTTIEVVVSGNAFKDALENPFAGIARGAWSFSTSTVNSIDEQNRSFALYPNPTSGVSEYSTNRPIRQITVTDLLGRVQPQPKWSDTKIDFTDLSQGFYLLCVTDDAGTKILRVIKE